MMSDIYAESITGQVSGEAAISGAAGATSPPFKLIFPRDSIAEFPSIGSENALYIDKSQSPNMLYRWDSEQSAYIVIGGVGGGGTNDYTQLLNLPKINGTTLTGDLSASDLGIESGTPGKDGVGIESVAQTTTSTVDGGENVITVTMTDGGKSTFAVKNGSKGTPGQDGAPGSAGIFVGNSEEDAAASGATIWVNPDEETSDTVVTASTFASFYEQARGTFEIDMGKSVSVSVSASSYADVEITFSKEFSQVPQVMLGLVTGSTGAGSGSISVSPIETTTTGCTARVFNADSSGRAPAVRYLALLI